LPVVAGDDELVAAGGWYARAYDRQAAATLVSYD
jgi:hypothetical protein